MDEILRLIWLGLYKMSNKSEILFYSSVQLKSTDQFTLQLLYLWYLTSGLILHHREVKCYNLKYYQFYL